MVIIWIQINSSVLVSKYFAEIHIWNRLAPVFGWIFVNTGKLAFLINSFVCSPDNDVWHTMGTPTQLYVV